jgi:hypothetical protein
MAHSLTEGLLKRANQWKAFHEWEQNRRDVFLTFEERVAWYAAALDFTRHSLGMAITADKREKTNWVLHLHSRLKHLKRSDRNV